MKKMKVEDHGRVEWLEMTEENMDEIITEHYLSDIALEPMWSNEWEEWTQPGEKFYWVEDDPMPSHHDAMEWIIEEVVQLRTGDPEDERL